MSDSLLTISQALYYYNKLIFFLATRLYSFLTCLVMILFWKGWFDIWQHEDENKMLRKHWDLSLCCLLIGSLLLSSLGCLKSAAVTPPLGVWLDRGVDYVRVDKFYSATENKEENGCWVFRLKNAGLTVLIEVLCLITYFGAWCVVDDLLSHQEFINHKYLNKMIHLLLAVFFSFLSYLLSMLYLYLHQTSTCLICHSVRDMAYASMLILATVVTATQFHAWWGLADFFKEDYFIILLGVGGTILLLAGVTTTNYFGWSGSQRGRMMG